MKRGLRVAAPNKFGRLVCGARLPSVLVRARNKEIETFPFPPSFVATLPYYRYDYVDYCSRYRDWSRVVPQGP